MQDCKPDIAAGSNLKKEQQKAQKKQKAIVIEKS